MCRRCSLVADLLAVVAATFVSSSARGELIVNGNFNGGNTGFTSEYDYNTDLEADTDRYAVGSDPQVFNPFFDAFVDHTSGSGNMMVVNGSQTAGKILWSQTVSVTQSTDYSFSVWATSAFNSAPANLTVTINDVQLGDVFGVPATPGDWQAMLRNWNSGGATSAVIKLYDDNTSYIGNDFALDDFSFDVAPVPEPSSLALVALAGGGAWWKRRRSQRTAKAAMPHN